MSRVRRLLPWFFGIASLVMVVVALAEISARQEDKTEAQPPTARPSPSVAPVRTPSATFPAPTTPLATPPVRAAQGTPSPFPTLGPSTPGPVAVASPRAVVPVVPTAPPLGAVNPPAPATGGGRTAATGGGALSGGLWVLMGAGALRVLARRR